jgi:hypothetical protein
MRLMHAVKTGHGGGGSLQDSSVGRAPGSSKEETGRDAPLRCMCSGNEPFSDAQKIIFDSVELHRPLSDFLH